MLFRRSFLSFPPSTVHGTRGAASRAAMGRAGERLPEQPFREQQAAGARRTARAAWVALGALAFGVGLQGDALAFCRTRTCEFDTNPDCAPNPVTGCSTVGEFAHWGSGCVSFAVQEDGSTSEGIDAALLQDLVTDGFSAWSGASCSDGGSPLLTAVDRGQTACDQVEFNCASDDNVNLVVFREGRSELDAFTIALTTVIANLKTGEILDADIEINSFAHDFSLGAAAADGEVADIRVVINHEVGHFLGLSHSQESGALMRALYDGDGFDPQDDDADGICQVFEDHGAADPACRDVEAIAGVGACVGERLTDCVATGSMSQTVVADDGCALDVGGVRYGAGWSALGLAAVAAVAAARRRRP